MANKDILDMNGGGIFQVMPPDYTNGTSLSGCNITYGGVSPAMNSANTSVRMLTTEDVRQMLIQKFTQLSPLAQTYWDNLFSKNVYKRKGKIPVGAITYPLTIWATENPVSFEWRIEQEFPSRITWDFEEVCTIPTRHKFLDRNFLDSNSVIIQFNPIKARPIVLEDAEPLISWYTGFVVETSYIQDNAG